MPRRNDILITSVSSRQRSALRLKRRPLGGLGTMIGKTSTTFLLLLALAFLLVACIAVQEASITPSILSGHTVSPITTESMPTISKPSQLPSPTAIVSSVIGEGVLTGRQALEAMYGNEALSISDTEATIPAPLPNYTTTVHINVMGCFWENLAEKCLVITDSAFAYCHACNADIDGAVFQRVNGLWELIVFQPTIISLGSFGYVPKGALIQIGPDKHAALIKSSWAGQGYTGEYATIIAEIDGRLQAVLNLYVSEMQEVFIGDDMTSLEWGYCSIMEFFEDNRSDFYKLVVTQYGINREGNKFKAVSLYTFSRETGKYVLVHQHQQ